MKYEGLVPVRFRLRGVVLCIHVAKRRYESEFRAHAGEDGVIPIRGAKSDRTGFSIVIEDCRVIPLLPVDSQWREQWSLAGLGDMVYLDVEACRVFVHVSKQEPKKSRGDRGDGLQDRAMKDALVATTIAELDRLKSIGGKRSGLRTAAMNVAMLKGVPVPSDWGDFEGALVKAVTRECREAKEALTA